MKSVNTPSNEAPPVINKYTKNYLSRCPNCNLICSLKLNYNEGKYFIHFECENKHEGNITLKEYLIKYSKYCLSKEKCKECGKDQKEVKGNFMYCSKCDRFICNLCIGNHIIDDTHNIINLRKYDSLCKIHSNAFCFYCRKCKRNLCIYCKVNHKSHGLIDLSELKYTQYQKNKLENEILNLEKKIISLNEVKHKIVSLIDSLKKSSELELKFIKLLLYTYQYEESQNNLNYYVMQNLKNFEDNLQLDKMETYDKICQKGNEYISFLQKLKINNFNKENIKPNSLKNNFKILQYHTDSISYLSKLIDGRLISCSWDKSLNIYKKDTYELQLSIKEHTDCVSSFTQVKNGKIITCSSDKSMKIIQLIEEDKYIIDQILLGHSDWVMKVLEINDYMIISVSYDRTMKIWKLNYEKKYDCYKTIIFQNTTSFCDILRVNQNEFVTLSKNDKCLKFWNSTHFSFISKILNIETSYGFKMMCLLDNDILCIGGIDSKGFYLIQISTHHFIKNINGPEKILTIIKCSDGLLLCSIIDENGNNTLVKYKYENQDLKLVFSSEKSNDRLIYSCVELDNGIIASGGDDNIIKLWKD